MKKKTLVAKHQKCLIWNFPDSYLRGRLKYHAENWICKGRRRCRLSESCVHLWWLLVRKERSEDIHLKVKYIQERNLGGGGALGVRAPPTFHTLAKEISINRSVAHSGLGLKHVLSRPSYNKYTYAPLSKLPSCAPYVMHMLYNNGLHLATRTSELLEW